MSTLLGTPAHSWSYHPIISHQHTAKYHSEKGQELQVAHLCVKADEAMDIEESGMIDSIYWPILTDPFCKPCPL